MLTFLSLLFVTASAGDYKDYYDCSVCKDATYWVADKPCSGSGADPAGYACPKYGDYTKKDCNKYLKSYADYEKCVAFEDAECKKLATGAWGCVFPSLGCDLYKPPTKPTHKPVYKPTYKPTPAPTKPYYPPEPTCDYYWEYPEEAVYNIYPEEKKAVELNIIDIKGEYDVNYIYYGNGSRAYDCVPYYAAYVDEYGDYVDYFKGVDGSDVNILDIFYTKTAEDAGYKGDYDVLYRAEYKDNYGDIFYKASGATIVIKFKCDGYYETCVKFDIEEFKYDDKHNKYVDGYTRQ